MRVYQNVRTVLVRYTYWTRIVRMPIDLISLSNHVLPLWLTISDHLNNPKNIQLRQAFRVVVNSLVASSSLFWDLHFSRSFSFSCVCKPDAQSHLTVFKSIDIKNSCTWVKPMFIVWFQYVCSIITIMQHSNGSI